MASPTKKPKVKKTPAKKAAKPKAPRPAKKAPTKKSGRPSLFSEAIVEAICDLIAQGFTLRQIAAQPGLPDKATMIRWLAREEKFRDQYARAKEVLAHVQADEILDIAEDSTNDWIERENQRTGETYIALNEEAVQRARVRIDARKWLMGKMAPKVYGDLTKIAVGGDSSNPSPVPVGVVMVPMKRPSDDDGDGPAG